MCSVVLTVLAVLVVFVVFARCRFCDEFVQPQSLLPQHTYIYTYIQYIDRETAQAMIAKQFKYWLPHQPHRSASQTQHTQHTQSRQPNFQMENLWIHSSLFVDWTDDGILKGKKNRNSMFGLHCKRSDDTHFDSIFFLLLLFLFSAFWPKTLNVSFCFGSVEIRFFRRIFHRHLWKLHSFCCCCDDSHMQIFFELPLFFWHW